MKILISGAALALAAAGAVLAADASAGPSGYKVIGHVALTDGGWDYVNFDSANHRVLVGRSTGVSEVDVNTLSASLLPGPNVHGAIPVNGGKELLTTDGAAGGAHILDGRTGANLATIPTGRGPDSARVDPHSGLAMVMNHAGGDIALIDVKQRKVVGAITVGGTLEEAVADGAGKAYVNLEDKNEVVALDIDGRKVLAHYPMAGCTGPTGLTMAVPEKLLFVACGGSSNMAVVKADTGALVKLIKTGAGADGIAYDPARHLIFVPGGRDGNLTVLQLKGQDVTSIDTVTTQRGARTLTIDPASGRLYLMTSQVGAAPAGGRAASIPGSFEVMVVGK